MGLSLRRARLGVAFVSGECGVEIGVSVGS